MDVDFSTKGEGNSPAGNSPPATTPPPPASLTPTTEPAVAPTTAPSAQPVHIHWAGQMHMVPNDQANAEPLPQGKAIIHFAGAPVWLHRTGTDRQTWVDANCANLKYQTADSSGPSHRRRAADPNQRQRSGFNGDGARPGFLEAQPHGDVRRLGKGVASRSQ